MNPIKLFLTLSAILCVSMLYAVDNNTYIKQQVAYKDQGASGKELTWDFGMLSPINEEYTVAYSIPDSNYMHQWCATEHRTRYYYTLTADTIWRTGYENPTTFVQYTQPEAVLRLPLRYGDTLSTTFAAKGEYGHRTPMTLSGTNTIEVDAQGQLILPDKTYEQVLRVHSQRQYVESGLDSTAMLVDKYQWFAAESYIPVFESVTAYEMVEDSMQLAFQTSFYYHVEDTTDSTPKELAPIVDETAEDTAPVLLTDLSYLPNPVQTDLQVHYTLVQDATVYMHMHNALGMPMYSTSARTESAGEHMAQINMNGWMQGDYTLYIHADDQLVQQVVIKK
jgi:hypothetical protein